MAVRSPENGYTNEFKIRAFEYVVQGLANWFKECSHISDNRSFNNNNDLNKLKILKLHFFVTAAKSDDNQLLNVFNNFSAMPYGHVESDIYNALDSLERYDISNYRLTIKDDYLDTLSQSFDSLESWIKDEIDASIKVLRKINNIIILYTAFQLVELSHSWFSWKSMFAIARSHNKLSESIPSRIIREENKNFRLAF
jgi:uncharacterized phage-associated protein